MLSLSEKDEFIDSFNYFTCSSSVFLLSLLRFLSFLFTSRPLSQLFIFISFVVIRSNIQKARKPLKSLRFRFRFLFLRSSNENKLSFSFYTNSSIENDFLIGLFCFQFRRSIFVDLCVSSLSLSFFSNC